jgi:hypothetical protein
MIDPFRHRLRLHSPAHFLKSFTSGPKSATLRRISSEQGMCRSDQPGC